MKKRLMSAVLVATLIITMCVPVSAKRVFIQTSPNGGGYWAEVPDDKNNDSSSSKSGSSKGSSSSNAGGQTNKEPVFTTPTGQPITDSLIQLLAASMQSDGNVAPVSKNTVIAYSKFIKALGLNAALVTAFVPTGDKAQKGCKISNGLIAPGLSYTVMVQRPDGKVEFIQPTSVTAGSLKYDRPAGPIASIAVVCNAVAPK